MLAATALVAAACQTPPPPAPPPAPSVDPMVLERLLGEAARAYRAGDLDNVDGNGAADLYGEVQRLDPGNEDARRGLEQVVDAYLERASRFADQGSYASARSMIARARMLDPAHPNLQPTTERVQFLSTAERSRIRLAANDVRARSAQASEALVAFGAAARGERCRSTIFSTSDADGRWIYQQLSRAPGEGRIRATFELGSPHARGADMCHRRVVNRRTVLLAIGAPAVLAIAGCSRGPDVRIANGRIRAMAPGQNSTAAYCDIINTGPTDVIVTGAATCGPDLRVELHETRMHNGRMRMRRIPELTIAAGETATLRPGGMHWMLMGMQTVPEVVRCEVPVTPGGSLPMVLQRFALGTDPW